LNAGKAESVRTVEAACPDRLIVLERNPNLSLRRPRNSWWQTDSAINLSCQQSSQIVQGDKWFAAKVGTLLLRKRETGWQRPSMLGGFVAVIIMFLVWMATTNEAFGRLISIHAEGREEITGGVRLTMGRGWPGMLGTGTFSTVYPHFCSFYISFC
jgi:hypothetical protein